MKDAVFAYVSLPTVMRFPAQHALDSLLISAVIRQPANSANARQEAVLRRAGTTEWSFGPTFQTLIALS